jgi:hypothetical protein
MGTRKCAYNHCLHGGTINLDEDAYEKDGTRYYHKDCIKDRNNVALIRYLWNTRISRTVSYGLLNKVVYQIVDEMGVPTDYILFALRRVIAKNKPLHHPFGLKYYMDDEEIKVAYKNRGRNKEPKKEKADTKQEESKTFEYKPIVDKGFSSIFGGD